MKGKRRMNGIKMLPNDWIYFCAFGSCKQCDTMRRDKCEWKKKKWRKSKAKSHMLLTLLISWMTSKSTWHFCMCVYMCISLIFMCVRVIIGNLMMIFFLVFGFLQLLLCCTVCWSIASHIIKKIPFLFVVVVAVAIIIATVV